MKIVQKTQPAIKFTMKFRSESFHAVSNLVSMTITLKHGPQLKFKYWKIVLQGNINSILQRKVNLKRQLIYLAAILKLLLALRLSPFIIIMIMNLIEWKIA